MSMMRLSEAARAIPAELRGEDRMFDAVSTDTRALPPQALFVALKGARYDGHDFLAQAALKDIAGALVRQDGQNSRRSCQHWLLTTPGSRWAGYRHTGAENFLRRSSP